MADANRIQSSPPEVIQTNIERMVIPHRAPLDSERMNRFAEQTMQDILQLASQGNVTARAVRHVFHTMQLETDAARQRSLALESSLAFDRKLKAKTGHRIPHWADFHDTEPLMWVPNSSISRRAAISAQYGEATLPMNAAESRTYSLRLLAGGTIAPSTLLVSTTGTFDKGAGDGVTDYEYGGTVEETDPKNMANGNNDLYWRRRVIFDLHSDYSEVECEVTMTVPESANLRANLLYMHPFPLGNVDITGIWVSPDLSGSFTEITNFEEVLNSGKRRWFFPAQKVARIKVRLRQRGWFEEEGRKIFEYGLQELGLMLVEWDQHYDTEATQLTDNHAFVVKFTPESGYRFSKLYGVYSDPDWTLESADNRHVHMILSKDQAGTQVLWDSDSNSAPQNLSAPLDMGSASELYLIVTMNWCESVPTGSPFQANTTPFLRGVGLDVTYVAAGS